MTDSHKVQLSDRCAQEVDLSKFFDGCVQRFFQEQMRARVGYHPCVRNLHDRYVQPP